MNTFVAALHGFLIGADVVMVVVLFQRHGVTLPFVIPMMFLVIGVAACVAALVRRVQVEETVREIRRRGPVVIHE